MNVLIFGASGMVGGGVLRECLLAPDVEHVVSIGRSALPIEETKLAQVVLPAFTADISAIADDDLRGVDACFFCIGVSSAGMTEDQYTALTFGLTVAVAERLAQLSPQATFVYVSGAGADSSEQGSSSGHACEAEDAREHPLAHALEAGSRAAPGNHSAAEQRRVKDRFVPYLLQSLGAFAYGRQEVLPHAGAEHRGHRARYVADCPTWRTSPVLEAGAIYNVSLPTEVVHQSGVVR